MAAFSRLNSNCGVESLQLEFIECRDCGPDPGVDCSVLLVGSHWSADEIKQVRVDLSCLHLSLAAISALTSELGRWVSLPLE